MQVEVVDCTDFTQCRSDSYKFVPVENAFSFDTPELSFSRYEVLKNQYRKMYFDIDGVEDTPENQNIAQDFMRDYEEYLKTLVKLPEPLKYVITTNKNSTGHPGIGFHVIVWNYHMDYKKQYITLIGFKETSKGQRYAKYVDTVVYSSLRLFKLPNFIGIPMNNVENYHRPDPSDKNIEHYLIQSLNGTQLLEHRLHVPQDWVRKERKVLGANGLASSTNWKFYNTLMTVIKEFQQPKSKTEDKRLNPGFLNNNANILMNSPQVSEADKKRLSMVMKRKGLLLASVIEQLCHKYDIDLREEQRKIQQQPAFSRHEHRH